MTLATWITFFLACWAISLSPGPGAIAAMSAGLNQGFRRGYFTVFGLVLGIWTQVVIVVAGLGAIIAASNTAFTVLKFLGAAYLVWIGIAQWRASDKPLVASADAPASPAASWSCAAGPSMRPTPRARCSCWRWCPTSSTCRTR